MLSLSNIVLYATVSSLDRGYLERTLRVLDWCNHLAKWQNTILYSALEPPKYCAYKSVQIPFQPDLPYGHGFQVFQGRTLPLLLLNEEGSSFLCVHEDGFPLEPQLWTDQFAEFDWIGPAWPDDIVGGSGFCLRSRWMLNQMLTLPWMRDGDHDDTWACRKHRQFLLANHAKFPTPEVANQFCTETVGNDRPSFGFHGREWSPVKYKQGWERIERWERGQ